MAHQQTMPWLKEALLKEMKATLFCWQVEGKRMIEPKSKNHKNRSVAKPQTFS